MKPCHYSVAWEDDEYLSPKQRSEALRAAEQLLQARLATALDETHVPMTRLLALGTRAEPRSVLLVAQADSSTVKVNASLPASFLVGQLTTTVNRDVTAGIAIYGITDGDPVSLWTSSCPTGPRSWLYRATRKGLVQVTQAEFDAIISNPPKECAEGMALLVRLALEELGGSARARILSKIESTRDGSLWERGLLDIVRRSLKQEPPTPRHPDLNRAALPEGAILPRPNRNPALN